MVNIQKPSVPMQPMTNSRFLQMLFGLMTAVFLFVGIAVVNTWVISMFSVDGQLSPSTSRRVVHIQVGFVVLGLIGAWLSRLFGRKQTRQDISAGMAQFISAIALFLFLALLSEGLLAVYFPPAYLPSQSTEKPLALPDARLGYVLNTAYNDAYRINSSGFRGDEVNPDPAVRRVVCLGDSVTFGLELNNENGTFPVQLQRLFHDGGWTNVQVVNAGIPGYASENALRFAELELDSLKPALLIVCIGWNDLITSYYPDWKPHSLITGVQPPADKTPLALIRAARALKQKLAHQEINRQRYHVTMRTENMTMFRKTPHPDALAQFERNLAALARLCGERRIPLLLMNMPTILSMKDMTDAEKQKASVFTPEAAAEFESVIERVCRAENANCLLDVMNLDEGGKDRFFWDHCHVTEEGSREMARRVFEYLSRTESRLFSMNP